MFILYNIMQVENIKPHHHRDWLSELPPEKQAQIRKLQDSREQLSSLIGLQLLKTGMRLLGQLHFQLNNLQFSERGKPHAESPVYFNISHAGSVIACALSKSGPIGLDLEPKRPKTWPTLKPYFNQEELHLINKEPDNLTRLWTRKEAVVKAYGDKGLEDIAAVKLNGTEATLYESKWQLYDIPLHEDYYAHTAVNSALEELTLCEIELP